jgi:hypothetical protein
MQKERNKKGKRKDNIERKKPRFFGRKGIPHHKIKITTHQIEQSD